jgi:hypothetical protein
LRRLTPELQELGNIISGSLGSTDLVELICNKIIEQSPRPGPTAATTLMSARPLPSALHSTITPRHGLVRLPMFDIRTTRTRFGKTRKLPLGALIENNFLPQHLNCPAQCLGQ